MADNCTIYGVRGKNAKQTSWIYAKFNTKDKYEIDVIISKFNNGDITKWGKEHTYVNSKGETVPYLTDRNEILSLNKRDFVRLISDYYDANNSSIYSSAITKAVDNLNGWTSTRAKLAAVKHTAIKIKEEFYRNLAISQQVPLTGDSKVAVKSKKLTKEEVIDKVRNGIINDFFKTFTNWIKTQEALERELNTTRDKEETLFKNKLEEYREKGKNYNDALIAFRKDKGNKELFDKAESARQALFDFETATIANYANGNIKLLNLSNLAQQVFGVQKATEWINSALSLSDMVDINRSFENVKLERLGIEDYNDSDNDDLNTDEESVESDSTDKLTSIWDDNVLPNYIKHYDSTLKLYFSLLPQQSAPVVGRKNDLFVRNNELGTIEYMDARYIINELQSIGPVRDEYHFINEIEKLAKTNQDLYGLGQLVNDMRSNILFAKRVYRNFKKPLIAKTQNVINDSDYVSTKISNSESYKIAKISYELLSESNFVGRGEFVESDTNSLEECKKIIKEKEITTERLLNVRGKFRNNIKRTVVNFVKKHFPSINSENLINWFFDNPESANINQLETLLDGLIRYNKALYVALKNENEYKSQFSKLMSNYNRHKKELEEGEIDYTFKPEYHEEDINRKERDNSIIELSNILLNVAKNNIRLNTPNAAGKMSSSINKNSYITDFFDQLRVQLENGKDGREILKEFFTKKKYDVTDVETNTILFGLEDDKGNVIREGLFKKDKLGDYYVNENAKELLNAFGLSLYDGTNKVQASDGIVYDKMTREDFLLSSIFTFNAAIRFEGFEKVDSKNFGNFMMRIPSDASNIYAVQMPKYSSDDLYDYGSDYNISAKIDKHIANLEDKYVDAYDNVRKENKELSSKWLSWYLSLIRNNNFVQFKNVLNETQMVSLLLNEKRPDISVSLGTNFVFGDYVYTPYVYKSDENSFVVLTKGKLDENKLFSKEAKILFIGSIKKEDYDMEISSEELTTRDTKPVLPMLDSFLKDNKNAAKKVLFENGEINRKYNRKSSIFFAYRNELWGELQQFATNLNNVFKEDKNGNLVLTSDKQGLFEYFHYNDSSFVKDGKLTGNIFKFTKLFNVGFDVNDAIEKEFALYDANGNKNYTEPLFIQNSEGNLMINPNRINEDSKDLFYFLTNSKVITVGKDFQSHIKGIISDTIDNIVENWLNSYTTYITQQRENFSNILNSKYNNVSFEQWALNMPLAYMTFDGLFEGSSKYYKNPQTFQKRAKETQMGGSSYVAGTMGEFRTDLYNITSPDGTFQEIVIEKDGINLLDKIPTITSNNTLKDSKMFLRNGWRGATVKNSETKYAYATNIYNNLREEIKLGGITEESVANKLALDIAKKFGDVYVGNDIIIGREKTNDSEEGDSTKANDGQSFITIEEFIRRRFADGTLEDYIPLLTQLLDPKVDIKDINISEVITKIQVQKNVYYDVVYDEQTGQHRPRQIKNAEFVLIPKLLDKESSLYKLYQLMRKHDIGQINTIETSKASNKDVLTFWDDNGNVDVDAFEASLTGIEQGAEAGIASYPAVEIYYYNHLYKQLDVVDHIEDKENKAGIQLFKKIQDNAVEKTKEYADAIQKGFAANIRESYYDLVDRLGWKVITDASGRETLVNKDGTPNLIKNYFYKECLREFQRIGLDKNVEDYLIPGLDGKPLMPEWYPILSTKLENVAQAVFNNNITRQTIPGYHGVQVTNIGWSKKLKYYPPVEEGNNKSAQLPVVEIMIPAYSKPIKDAIKKFGKEKVLEMLRAKGLDEHIGYRIPTEGKQSMAIFRIADFLDEAYGSTIVVADEWVTQTSSDFDVDSIFSLLESIEFRNGEFSRIEFDIAEGEENTKNRYIKKLLDYGNKKDRDIINANLDNFEKIKERGERMGISFDYFSSLTTVQQLTKDARNNYIIDNILNILRDKSSLEEIFGRSNFDDIKNNKDEIESISGLGFSNSSVYNPFDQLKFMQNAIDGKKLKALSVNRDTAASKANRTKVYLEDGLEIKAVYDTNNSVYNKNIIESSYKHFAKDLGDKRILVTHKQFGWSFTNRNVVGKLITSYSSQTTAHILDAIKEGALFNETLYTFGTFKTLIDSGIDYRTAISWLYQPAITTVNNINNETNSIYLDVSKNPDIEAIVKYAKELNLTDSNYIKIDDIYSKLQELYKEDFDEIISEIFFTNSEERNFAINGNALINRLSGKDVNNKTDISEKRLQIRNAIFDLFTAIQFKDFRNRTNNIEKIAKVLSPDSFGAKQIIRDVRNIINDVENLTKKYEVEDGVYRAPADILYQEYEKDGKIIKRNIIDAIYTEEDSAYEYLYAFYKYATVKSYEINSKLFVTEQPRFQAVIKDIEDKIGSRLTNEQYLKAKKYIVASIFKGIPMLCSPIEIDEHNFAIIDKQEIYDNSNVPYWETELGRIYGFGETESNTPKIDLNNPSIEDINIYKKLTPAQKVLFMQSNFEDAVFFSQISVTKFFKNEITNKHYSYNRIYLNDLSYNIEEVRNNFELALFNKNPLIKLAAIDILKYAFIVEGYNFKNRAVSKAIPNKSIFSSITQGGLSILDASLKSFDDTINIPPFVNNYVGDNFVRANSDLIKPIYIKKESGTKENPTISDLLLSCIRKGKFGLIAIPKTEQYEPLRDNLGFNGKNAQNYKRLQYNNGSGYHTHLFKLLRDPVLTYDYLIPINLLEPFENIDVSINRSNNEHDRDYQYYLYEILQDANNGIADAEEAVLEDDKDVSDVIKSLDDKDRSATLNWIKLAITKTKEELLEKLPKYKYKNVTDEYKLINTYKTGTDVEQAQLKKFFNDVNDTLELQSELPEGVNNLIFKNSSPLIKKLLGVVSTNGFVSYYIPTPNGKENTKVKITPYRNTYFLEKENNTIKKNKDTKELQYYFDRFKKYNNGVKQGDVLYKIEIMSEEDIDERQIDYDDSASAYDTFDELFTGFNTFDTELEKENISSIILKDIKFNLRHGDELAEGVVSEIRNAGININSIKSVNENYKTLYGIANKYFKRAYDKIIAQINNFELENGNSYSISDTKLYQEATPRDFNNLLNLVLKANHFIGSLNDLSVYNFSGADNETTKEILLLKNYADSLKNNYNIKIAFNKIFDKYLVAEYSSNPLLKTSFTDVKGQKHYMLNATDIFGDVSALSNAISDIGHIPNKQIQLVVRAINNEIYAAEYRGRQKVVDFDKFIKEEIGDNPNEVFKKIIDSNGRIIQPYTEQFMKDYYNKKNELLDYSIQYGRYSKQYFEKNLEFEKWAIRNLEQEIVKDYYKKLVKIKEDAYNVLGEELIRYNQIEYLLYNVYDDSYSLTDEQIEEKRKLILEVDNMRERYTEDGDFKPVEELKKVDALDTYIKEKAKLNNKYYETVELDEFKDSLNYHLSVITNYDKEHPNLSLDKKLDDVKYNISYKWILANTNYKLNSSALDALSKAYETLGYGSISRRSPFVRDIFAEKKAKGKLYDIYGRVIGTNFTEEEIEKLHESEQIKYGFNNSPGGYDNLTDYAIYKNVPPHRILSKTFWNNYYNSETERDSGYIKKVQEINHKINELISKGVNKDTGIIELHRLYTNCTQKELDELISLYRELRELDRIKEEYFESSGKKLFTYKVNDAAFTKQLDVYLSSKNATERRLFEDVFCDIDANGIIKRDRKGKLVPSKFLYGYVDLKDSVIKAHPEFIDTAKEEALKLINDNEEFVPTEYYYEALENARRQSQLLYDKAKSEGKNDNQAEEIRDNYFDTWYNNNHIWNKYKGAYQPLSIWTERRIKATGTLSKEFKFEPTFDNTVRSVKDEYKNPKYSTFRTNYTIGGDYDSKEHANILKDENSKEAKLYRQVEAIMNAARIGNSNRRFLNEGWAPRKYKIKPDADWVVKQGLGAFGLNFKDYNNKSWTENINYYTDHAIPNSMLQDLKFKGYKALQRIPSQEFGQSDEDYQAVVKQIREQNDKIREENLKNEKAFRDEDWYNVFRQFIYNQEQINARERVKNLGYLTIDDIKQRNVYKVNAFGKVSTSKYSQDSSPEYIHTSQRKLEDIFSNWLRRIIYSEYKELSPYNKVADTLQNMSSAKYMMFNIYAAVNNVTVGAVNILGEIFAKDYFDSKTWLEASKIYGASIFNLIKDTFSETSNDRTTAIIKRFNAIEIDRTLDFTDSEFELSKFAERFNTIAYSLQSSGESAMQNRALIAILKSHRIVTDDKTGKKQIMCYGEYSSGLELAALKRAIENNEYALEKLNRMIAIAKQDKQLQYEYDKLKRNIITDFFNSMENSSDKKEIYDSFVSLRKEMLNNSKEEFEKFEDVWNQFELVNGVAQFKEDSGLTDYHFGTLKNKVIYVNKKIHGVYDKNGAAQIERKWYGSLVMQFKKHIYPGIMKRWRTKGYYNETRGTFEKGSYISLFDFLSMEFKTFGDKRDKRMNRQAGEVADAHEQDYQTNTVLASIQTIFECILDTIHNFKYNYNILPTWEQNNIRRALADLCGIMAALLTTFLIYALTDDDDLEDSTLLNSTLYLADRLYGESRMYMPQGIVPEVRTQWSQPVAGAGVIKDLYTAMGAVNSWLFDQNYNPVYESGPNKGKNKVAVVVKRNIPAVRTVQRISTINSSNKYYRIGDNGVSQRLIKNLALDIRNE